MKNRHITILAATALAIAALALAGCDRTIDDINPEPISPGATGPGTAYQHMEGVPPVIEVPEDTTSGGGGDTVVGDDVPDVGDTEFEINACTDSRPAYCECIQTKDYDAKYEAYCDCFAAAYVPALDNQYYCGCCFFAFEPGFPEHEGNGMGDDLVWKWFADSTCNGIDPDTCEWTSH